MNETDEYIEFSKLLDGYSCEKLIMKILKFSEIKFSSFVWNVRREKLLSWGDWEPRFRDFLAL